MTLRGERNYDNLIWLERHGNFMSNIATGPNDGSRVRWQSKAGGCGFLGEGHTIMEMYDNLFNDVKNTLWEACT